MPPLSQETDDAEDIPPRPSSRRRSSLTRRRPAPSPSGEGPPVLACVVIYVVGGDPGHDALACALGERIGLE
ncbi:MAG TPA: hypothetical protein VGG06_01290 [Thermoanaerobaculia bacterium]